MYILMYFILEKIKQYNYEIYFNTLYRKRVNDQARTRKCAKNLVKHSGKTREKDGRVCIPFKFAPVDILQH